MSKIKNVAKSLEKVDKVRKRYSDCSLEELIWLKCDLESSYKFAEDTSTSYTSLFVSFMIPILTFMGGLISTFVAIVSSQIKVFTNDDRTKTIGILKEILTFLVDNSIYMMYCFYLSFLVALVWMYVSKLITKKNHLRYLILKELIDKARATEKILMNRT